MSAGRARRRTGGATDAAATAHELRSSLNGIRAWAHVLESRLDGFPDAMARRALQGIHASVDQQVRIIENRLEAGMVQPPLRRPAMSKRNDAQPEVPDDTPHKERPRRPDPDPVAPEAPGGSDAKRAEEAARNKTRRRGER